jgi:hypothetical protein
MPRGRPARNGHRELNGKLKRMAAAERNASLGEKIQVLSQPHRRAVDIGDALDQKRESILGRFVIRNKLRPELYDAGIEFGSLCRHFYHSKGVTTFIREGHRGSGLGISPAKTAQLEREVERLEAPLLKLSAPGFSAVRTMCVFENEIAPQVEPAAIIVLAELATLLRKTGRR